MRALGRRWYLVAVGLVLTGAMVAGAYVASPPKYNASALVLMLPAKGDVGNGGNPFLMLDGLEQPAGIVAAYFSSEPSRDEVKRVSPDAEYEVGIDDSTRGPVLAVDVTDTSPQAALQTLDFLLQRIPEELSSLQQQVDARGSAVVTSMPLSVDTQSTTDARGTIRAMIAALVVGLVGTVVASFTLDGILLRRRYGAWPVPRADDQDEPDVPVAEPAPAPSPVQQRVDPARQPAARPRPAPAPAVAADRGTRPSAADRDARPSAAEPEDDRPTASGGWSWGEQAS